MTMRSLCHLYMYVPMGEEFMHLSLTQKSLRTAAVLMQLIDSLPCLFGLHVSLCSCRENE